MTLVDNAVYVDGQRSADPARLNETYELLRAGPWSSIQATREAGPVMLLAYLRRATHHHHLHPYPGLDTGGRTGKYACLAVNTRWTSL